MLQIKTSLSWLGLYLVTIFQRIRRKNEISLSGLERRRFVFVRKRTVCLLNSPAKEKMICLHIFWGTYFSPAEDDYSGINSIFVLINQTHLSLDKHGGGLSLDVNGALRWLQLLLQKLSASSLRLPAANTSFWTFKIKQLKIFAMHSEDEAARFGRRGE